MLSPKSALNSCTSEDAKSISGSNGSEDSRNWRHCDPDTGAYTSFVIQKSCGDHKIIHLVPLSFLGFPIGRGFKTALVTFRIHYPAL